jgi:glucose/arabinose dehydrogenase
MSLKFISLSSSLKWAVSGFILLWISACTSAPQSHPAQMEIPTPVSTMEAFVEDLPKTTTLGTNLLAAADVSIDCDHPDGANMLCEADGAQQQISVEVDASNFARWTLSLPDSGLPLTGREVLSLDLAIEGQVDLNLYLVEADGRRIYRRLARTDLPEDGQTLYIPLREVRDESGVRVDADALREIQIVFEWADMVGALLLDDLRFLSVWEETIPVPSLPEGLTVPDGFVIEPAAAGLQALTQIEVISEDKLLVSGQDGRIWWYEDRTGDGFYESRQLYASGFWEVVGLLYDPTDGAVWIGGRGFLWHTLDTTGDGIANVKELRVEGLPWGRHQNNGLIWNPVADPFSGEPAYSWIYFGLGSTGDLEVGEELSATVLRFPRDGSSQEDLQVVARGVRNAYGLLWAPIPHEDGVDWALFAGENGPDFHHAPDEVNHIRWQHHYGFPEQYGMVEPPEAEGDPYSSPVYEVDAHASANSLAYVQNPDWPEAYRTLYVSLFGSVFSPDPVGQTVDRIDLRPIETASGTTYRGESSIFIGGLDRPLPLVTDANGNMLVGDYATGIIYRVRYVGEEE